LLQHFLVDNKKDMKKNIFIIITLTLLMLACSNPQPQFLKELVKEQNNRYKENKTQYFVPQEIFSHFPDNITESYPVGQTFSLDDQRSAYRYFFLICLNNNEKFFKKNETIAKKIAIKNWRVEDTANYFIVPTMPYYSIKYLFITKVPIPDFRFGKNVFVEGVDSIADSLAFHLYFSDDFPCGLTEDYEIYIIDTQNEYKTFSDEYKDVFAALPRTKNTGFSRGICVNKKKNVLIFWTIIF
jgi:hypothetical protein